MFCSQCGAVVFEGSKFCDKCGNVLPVGGIALCAAPQAKSPFDKLDEWNERRSQRSWMATLVLSIYFGFFGADRFCAGKTGTGILKLALLIVGAATLRIFIGIPLILAAVIWVFIDIFKIASGTFTDAEGKVIAPNVEEGLLDENERQEIFGTLSDNWIWILAFTPIASALMQLTGMWLLWVVVNIFLNSIFMLLDCNELNKKGYNIGNLLILGLLFVPVYMFLRAGKTNQKYGYAITWCVTFVFSMIISVIITVATLII